MMVTKEEILRQVASGELSPDEAAVRLDELASQPRPALTVTEEPVARVRVRCRMGGVEIVGDPSVSQAVADGEHVARREGDTLVIDVAAFGSADDEGFRFSRGGWGAWFPWGFVRQPNVVRVRVRPDMPVVAEVEAGSVSVTGTHGTFDGEVSAGSCRLDGFEGTFDVRVHAGSFNANARLTHGTSHVSCDAGSARINLLSGSNVRVSARSTMGSVRLFSGTEKAGLGATNLESTLGDGVATLDVESRMGSIRVVADE